MKQIAYLNTVDLTLVGGDVDVAIETLRARSSDLHFDRLGPEVVRVEFSTSGDFSMALGSVLDELPRHGVTLRAIRQVGELEDAFIQRLTEDRLRGFSRAIRSSDSITDLFLSTQTPPSSLAKTP